MSHHPKNPAAVALGKMGKGVKRRFSAGEIKKRTERIKAVNEAKRKAKE